MNISKEFDYYSNLNTLIVHALLHLHFQISSTTRFVPVTKRNEILIKFLKPKLADKSLSNIKKDIKLMLTVARRKTGNLEVRLNELNKQANQTLSAGTDRLFNLLVHLQSLGFESQLFEEDSTAEADVLYMLEEQIEHGFDDGHQQVAPLSMLIQSERVQELIDAINHHSLFIAEMKEWNVQTAQAHIVLHPHKPNETFQ
ncbi:DUF2913 family protein [Vibrio mediterranei]|uniref:DUF2913 family protein n=1 Tax=Vibrio mediterranei TaxID=689 RepID=UPI0040696F6D